MDPMTIAAGAQVANGIYGFFSGQAAGEAAASWERYNAVMNYEAAQTNIQTSTAIVESNAMALSATTKQQNQMIVADMDTNAKILQATTLYNDQLMDNEMSLMWESAGLDLKQLENQRHRERGTTVANQAASGTVIGSGSNADVIIDQKTQEAMDAFVIRHGADIQASQIVNAKNKNLWEGEMALRKMTWEGTMATKINTQNALITNETNAAQQDIRNIATNTNAWVAKQTGGVNAQLTEDAYDMKAQNALVSGIFGGAATMVNSAYSGSTTSTTTNVSSASISPGTVTMTTPSLNTPIGGAGTSLLA